MFKDKKIICCFISLTLAFFMLVGTTVAWFANNFDTSSKGLNIRVGELIRFELATKGSASAYQTYENELGYDTVTPTIIDDVTYYKTSSTAQSVCVYVNDGSNFDNQTENSSISPGSSGKLTFSIIPTQQMYADEVVEVQIYLIPYILNDDRLEEVVDQDVLNLVKGHLMLFTNFNGEYYSGWINDNRVNVNVVQNQITDFTIYWEWTMHFENYLTDTQGLNSVCAVSEDLESDYQKIIGDVNLNPEKYFYYQSTLPPLVDENDNFTNINVFNNYYNQADEKIGIGSDFMLMKIYIDG